MRIQSLEDFTRVDIPDCRSSISQADRQHRTVRRECKVRHNVVPAGRVFIRLRRLLKLADQPSAPSLKQKSRTPASPRYPLAIWRENDPVHLILGLDLADQLSGLCIQEPD